MTILAFDFGTKNIGIAIGQKFTYTARPLTSITSQRGIPNWTNLKKIFLEWKPICVVVGLPLNIDGSKQKITYQSEKFARQIKKKFNIEVYLHDERLSTIEAKNLIFKRKGYKFLKKKFIDSQSAAVILESWLSI
ncbi:MAG TPA: Holliday junction resolvase RuvX [Buchnera sp. (in: enterobacteria)]|nr:Holliday junction resolvase RuvX [Buchnera sp. (in: enterobacteria)]